MHAGTGMGPKASQFHPRLTDESVTRAAASVFNPYRTAVGITDPVGLGYL